MRVHIHVLYGVVVVLLILNMISFITLSSRAAQISADQDSLREDLDVYIEEVRQENRGNIEEVVKIIAKQNEQIMKQRDDFEEEIKLIKSSQDDFSGVVDDVIQKIVSVRTDRSTGSGFIVDPQGYIVTNFHVIQGGQFVRVRTYEDLELNAEVIGANPFTDLALLKVSGFFDAIELADSDSVNIGEKVIAIGNPLGLAFTVTEGIVSATRREGPNGLEAYIQTDVTLNPGNSGGPLINTEGKVIGINNFKVGGAGTEGLGFALESEVIEDIVNQIANETLIDI